MRRVLAIVAVIVLFLLPAIGAGESLTEEMAKAGIVGARSQWTSGRIQYECVTTVPAKEYLKDPQAFAAEVEKQLQQRVESRRVVGRPAGEATLDRWRRELTELLKADLVDDTRIKLCRMAWSGKKLSSDVDDEIPLEDWRGDSPPILHSEARFNGQCLAVWENNVISSGNRGSVTTDRFVFNDIVRKHPADWTSNWMDDPAFTQAALTIGQSEQRFGYEAFWVKCPERKEEALVCPALGYMTLEFRGYYSPDMTGQLSSHRSVVQIGKFQDDVFPVEVSWRGFREDGSVRMDHLYSVSNVELNIPLPDEIFEADFPPDTIVTDHRLSPPLTYNTSGIDEVSIDYIDDTIPDPAPSDESRPLPVVSPDPRQPAISVEGESGASDAPQSGRGFLAFAIVLLLVLVMGVGVAIALLRFKKQKRNG